jgi:hypothetical protein
MKFCFLLFIIANLENSLTLKKSQRTHSCINKKDTESSDQNINSDNNYPPYTLKKPHIYD